jgi:hypothetical protein
MAATHKNCMQLLVYVYHSTRDKQLSCTAVLAFVLMSVSAPCTCDSSRMNHQDNLLNSLGSISALITAISVLHPFTASSECCCSHTNFTETTRKQAGIMKPSHDDDPHH